MVMIAVLFSGILALALIGGFALFQAGAVSSKNTVDILAKNFVLFAIACAVFLLCGAHLFFGEQTWAGVFPAFIFHFGTTVDALPKLFLQFTAVTVVLSLIVGATAERLKPWSLFLFALPLVAFIYPVLGYWVWNGGFLQQWGFIDMAGSGVIHLSAAAAAFALLLLIGPRQNRYRKNGEVIPMRGAQLPLVALGGFLVWMGFIGFDMGTVLSFSAADRIAQLPAVIINLCVAGSFGLLVALLLARMIGGTIDFIMMLNGAMAGMVAISAYPITAMLPTVALIGSIAGVLVVFTIRLLDRYKIDDPMGVLAAHGVAGIWGLLAVIFIAPVDRWHQLSVQLVGIAIIFVWAFVWTYLLGLILKLILGLRADPMDELMGLDARDCGMAAYPEFVTTKIYR